MQSSKSTDPSNPTNPTDDAQPPAMPEHSCATLAQAVKILQDGVTRMDALEKKHGSTLRSNLYEVDPEVHRDIGAKLDEIEKHELSFYDCLQFENDTTVIYAGNRFKFESPETVVEFVKAAEKDFEPKSDNFLVTMRRWKASICDRVSAPSSTPQG
ncbi:hypothetical protein M409DRAFT_15954 [Zasmidium cellare ATCC 36951]|uniref:Uncharacterized protein n=1 Tax=Zasmidium cellare ATCC 36951 TaxID=1080233 RepID=A0A6A6D2N9_ZASCE|nr:uncharacterized protein M409DRAFT_15954 [Zasmidium cellare ATCC 36951]KAF2173677.1 hypothetical protein M409DRAFT_15954 [Zasmidium cellare ATCC 36951]